jgi:aspartate/methionine/tyrosine aminotransferase
MRLNPATVRGIDSPIETAYALPRGRNTGRHLLDLAQAAPPYPPAPEVIEHIVAVARDGHGGEYTETAGLAHLRAAFAAELSVDYQAEIRDEHIQVTAGANQAFCLVASALAAPGDEVIVALPYYFNHDMWLRLQRITPVYLEPGRDLVPTAEAAEELITPRTRAIVCVSPGNPTGVTIPPAGIARFAKLADERGIALVLDETYRSFRDTSGPAHALFSDPGWTEAVVSLHSFSKDFAIPGHRVGAVVASPRLNREVRKLADCVAVCAPRIGQEAAWAGLVYARQWRRARSQQIAANRAGFGTVMAEQPGGFTLLTLGGFFGWVRHPFAGRHTGDVVRDLAIEHDTLVIPGTAFLPDDRATLRFSLSNLHQADLRELAARLSAAGFGWSAAPDDAELRRGVG